jgi:hypothetical protein
VNELVLLKTRIESDLKSCIDLYRGKPVVFARGFESSLLVITTSLNSIDSTLDFLESAPFWRIENIPDLENINEQLAELLQPAFEAIRLLQNIRNWLSYMRLENVRIGLRPVNSNLLTNTALYFGLINNTADKTSQGYVLASHAEIMFTQLGLLADRLHALAPLVKNSSILIEKFTLRKNK